METEISPAYLTNRFLFQCADKVNRNFDEDIMSFSADNSADSSLNFVLAFCRICQQETIKRCYKEHPEWFTPKSHKPSAKFRSNVYQYLKDNTFLQICMENRRTEHNKIYYEHICQSHLAEKIKELGE